MKHPRKLLRRVLVGIMTAAILVALTVVPAMAQPPTPCAFSGGASLDGAACPGSIITVQLADSTPVATIPDPVEVNVDSRYGVVIPQVGGVPAEGATLNFYVDGFLGGTGTWNAGGIKTLALVAVAGPQPPTITTNTATSVTHNSATLNGNLTGMGGYTQVKVRFQYGPTAAYGTNTTWQTKTGTGTFFAIIPGLTPLITYHFRAQVETVLPADTVTVNGGDLTFSTLTAPEDVLKPGLNTLSTPAYLDSNLGDIIPGDSTDWIGYQLTWSSRTGTSWSAVTASTTINPLDGFVIINLTEVDIELDVDNWPWAEWVSGDSPLLPPTKQLGANHWALVGPAPGLVNSAAPDIWVDDFMAGVIASRVVSPGWGDQAAWSAIYLPDWGYWMTGEVARPYKAYFVFPTATSQLTGSCTLP